MKRILLTVDLSYQTYRAAASHKALTDVEGNFTGGLYGFLVTLAKQIRETQATEVIITKDAKPYRRSLMYPEYKLIRKSASNQELKALYEASKPLVDEAIAELGFGVMAVEGFEADDCTGWIVHRHRHRYDEIYAASNDSDLYQLMTCPWFRLLPSDLASAIDARNLAAMPLCVTPEQFMLATALQGTHNDVAGIEGVGQVTAIKAVKDPALMRSYRERYNDLIERNLKLIKLPHPEFRFGPLPRRTRDFDHRSFYRFCSRFDIECTKSMLDSFEQVSV